MSKTMKTYKIFLLALISMAIAPFATAQVFKCDGPDGPIYSDRECEPGAEKVELSQSSGLGGISDETKAELAQKRQAREQERNQASNAGTVNNQYNVASDQNTGVWRRGRPRVNNPANKVPVARPLPSARPARRR
jgi:hypothetical protein